MYSRGMHCLWLVLVALVLLASLRAGAQTRSEYYYIGSMAGQPIQMDLTFAAPAITGTFLRDTDGRENKMKGRLRQGGVAAIDELNAKGNNIGTLTGTFSPDRHSFSGTWHGAESSKPMPVKLNAVADYVMQQQTQSRISVTSAYPHFLAASPALNKIGNHTRESIAAQQKQYLQLATENIKVLPADIKLSAEYHFAIKYYSRHLLACWKRRSNIPAARTPTPPTSPITRASTTAKRNRSILPASSNPAPPVSASSPHISSASCTVAARSG